VESASESADTAVGALLRDHAAGGGSSNLSLRDLEGVRGLARIAGIQRFSAALHQRPHPRADVLIALAAAFGLSDSLESGFVVGHVGLSF
jgi:hypothetical protein